MCKKLVSAFGSFFYIFKKRKLPKKIERILIFKIGAIGDVLMSTPLIKALDNRGYKVDYCLGNWAKQSVEGNPRLGRIINFDDNLIFAKGIKKYYGLLKLAKQIRKEKYDLIFVLDKSWQLSVLASLFGRFRIGFDRRGEGFANNLNVKYGEVKHDVNYYLSLSEFLGINSTDTDLEFVINTENNDFAEDFFRKNNLKGKKVIGLVPGGAKNLGVGDEPVRRWPSENFTELCIKLAEKNFEIILLGGPGDVELNESIKQKVGKNVLNAAGMKFGQSAAIMHKCAWIVCNDSGPMHLAAAVNTHIVSLFGPTNPARKAPLHKESVSFWKDRDIYEETYETYGKLPKRKDFMQKITVDGVLREIK